MAGPVVLPGQYAGTAGLWTAANGTVSNNVLIGELYAASLADAVNPFKRPQLVGQPVPPSGGGGTVTFDSVGPSSAGASSATAVASWTQTVVANGSALVVVGVFGGSNSAGVTLSCKLDPAGANTTVPSIGGPIRSGAAGGNESGFVQMFGLPNVAAGSHTIQLTASVAPSSGKLIGGSIAEANADTTNPFGTAQTASNSTISTTATLAHTGSVTGSRVVFGACGGSGLTISAGTSRWLLNDNITSGADNGAESDAAGGGTVTGTWTLAGSDWWAVIGVEVKAPAGGATLDGAFAPSVSASIGFDTLNTELPALAPTVTASCGFGGSVTELPAMAPSVSASIGFVGAIQRNAALSAQVTASIGFSALDTELPAFAPSGTASIAFGALDTELPAFAPTTTASIAFAPFATTTGAMAAQVTASIGFVGAIQRNAALAASVSASIAFAALDTALPAFAPTGTASIAFAGLDTELPAFAPTGTVSIAFVAKDTELPSFAPTGTASIAFAGKATTFPAFAPTGTASIIFATSGFLQGALAITTTATIGFAAGVTKLGSLSPIVTASLVAAAFVTKFGGLSPAVSASLAISSIDITLPGLSLSVTVTLGIAGVRTPFAAVSFVVTTSLVIGGQVAQPGALPLVLNAIVTRQILNATIRIFWLGTEYLVSRPNATAKRSAPDALPAINHLDAEIVE